MCILKLLAQQGANNISFFKTFFRSVFSKEVVDSTESVESSPSQKSDLSTDSVESTTYQKSDLSTESVEL